MISMLARLKFFHTVSAVATLLTTAFASPVKRAGGNNGTQMDAPISFGTHMFHIPPDSDPHRGTILTWPTSQSILNTTWSYPGVDVNGTYTELAALAKAIAKYEPVELFVLDPSADSDDIDGTNGSSYAAANRLLGKAANITLHPISDVDSLWARDTGPVFVYAQAVDQNGDGDGDGDEDVTWSLDTSDVAAVVLNFNQWGQKNLPTVDSYFAGAACDVLNYSAVAAPFIAEGGGIEVDGKGTLLATESAILNPNRNPGVDKEWMESYFAQVFDIKKTLWIPGVRDEDVTDDHIDSIARFAPNGVVLVSRPFVPDGENEDEYLADYNDIVDLFKDETDAEGNTLRVVTVQEPDVRVLGLPAEILAQEGATVSYINYHVVNGAVIVAKFGDAKADAAAAETIGKYYPGRVVEQVSLRQLGIQGGGIHCATQQIPGRPGRT